MLEHPLSGEKAPRPEKPIPVIAPSTAPIAGVASETTNRVKKLQNATNQPSGAGMTSTEINKPVASHIARAAPAVGAGLDSATQHHVKKGVADSSDGVGSSSGDGRDRRVGVHEGTSGDAHVAPGKPSPQSSRRILPAWAPPRRPPWCAYRSMAPRLDALKPRPAPPPGAPTAFRGRQALRAPLAGGAQSRWRVRATKHVPRPSHVLERITASRRSSSVAPGVSVERLPVIFLILSVTS